MRLAFLAGLLMGIVNIPGPIGEVSEDCSEICNESTGWAKNCHGSDGKTCTQILRDFGSLLRAPNVQFATGHEGASLRNLVLDNVRVAESLDLEVGNVPLTVGSQRALSMAWGATTLEIHDDPSGLVRLEGRGNVTLRLVRGVHPEMNANGTEGILHMLGGRTAGFRFSAPQWAEDGSSVRFTGPSAIQLQVAKGSPESRLLQKRTADWQVAAQVNIGREWEGNDVLAFDDVQAAVLTSMPKHPFEVLVQVEGEPAAKILAIKIANAPRNLGVRFFDTNLAGGYEVQTELQLPKADSMVDALDASDDAGQPEYFVFRDGRDTFVVASIPHWSKHALLVSEAPAEHEPNVRFGAALGLVAAAAATILLLRPWHRRR